MAEFNFFGRSNSRGEEVVPQKIIPLSAAYKESMEEVCEMEGVKYEVEYRDGIYYFSVAEDLWPRLEKYFYEPGVDPKEAPEVEHGGEWPSERKATLGDQIGSASGRRTPQRKPTPARRAPEKNEVGETKERDPEVRVEPDPKDLARDFGVLSIEEQQRIDERMSRSEAEKKKKKSRVKTGRDNQVKTRLTDTEMQLFGERVKASGMKQGDFMRMCLLYEEVNVRSLTDIDAQALGTIMEIASDLGRIGGLIKGTVVANKDNFAVLTPAAKVALEKELRELNTLKDDLQRVVQKLYGNS